MNRFALVGALLAGMAGCGVKKEVHQAALGRISTLETELDAERRRAQGLEGDLDSERNQGDAARKQRDAELAKVRGEKEATMAELVELRRQRDAAEKRLAAYRELQAKFRALVDTGKLEVLFRNGQMVLKLPSGILFPSGSDKLSKEGLAALGEVTNVLDQFKERRFVIAGHTDTVPIKSRQFLNNWYLSTARAISVLQFMIDAGFPPTSLAAAGYGEFDPIAANDTPQNREQNRRIEIILVPNLEELPSLTGEAP
jgi:chemotaxis protein MotB